MTSKILFVFVFFWAMIYTRDLSTTSSTNSVCNSCINSNNGSYWCSFSAYTEWGYCCNSSESKYGCIGSNYSSFECSTDSLPSRAEYLLCPTETSRCQSTNDFHITSNQQSRSINTGTVGSGRTCEYLITLYDPGTLSTYNRNNYDVTVDVEYVHSDAYLGVYKYHVDRHTTELIQEVGGGYTGAIQTTVNSTYEIYVQMYPNSSSSYAIFNISSSVVSSSSGGSSSSSSGGSSSSSSGSSTTYSSGTNETSDGGLSGGAVAAIVIALIICLIIAGLIGAYVIYVRYYKDKKKNNTSNRSPETRGQRSRDNENAYYIKNNPEVAYQSSYQGPKQGGGNSNFKNGTMNGIMQNNGARSNNYRVYQQETAARM